MDSVRGKLSGQEGKNIMILMSEVQTQPPKRYRSELQALVYRKLQELEILFERVDTEEVITMKDCEDINQKRHMKMVKTLFLCTRHQREMFLFITTGDRRFDSNSFSTELGVSRVSFAPEQSMEEMLGTKIGAATVFSVLLKSADSVRVVIDWDVLKEEYYGCSDGTTTGYMKVKTQDIVAKLLPESGHSYVLYKRQK